MAEKTLEQLQREHQELLNEDLAFRVAQQRSQRSERERLHETQEQTLAITRRNDRARMRGCSHRKGGKGDDLKNNRGNDPNYAIIVHTYSDQRVVVMCTRCFAEWNPGDTERRHPTGISYETAVQWPTDNSPSVAAQFLIPKRGVLQTSANSDNEQGLEEGEAEELLESADRTRGGRSRR